MRVIDLVTVASDYLKEKGFDNSRLEAERLLGSVLGLSRIDLYMEFDRPLTEKELVQFRGLVRRRLAHEPLQYITGSAGFWEQDLKTDSRVFIPRPETEILVQAAVDFLRQRSDPLFADLGTGSGAIAVSVLYEITGARAVVVDISDEALLLAEQNARMAGVAERIFLVYGDMLNGLAGRGPFDAILSNPPYVRTQDISTLQPEVRDFEPITALDGGSEGLRYLTAIATDAHRYLKPGGLLLLECEGAQADMVQVTLQSAGRYSGIEIIRDLAGTNRVVKAFLS